LSSHVEVKFSGVIVGFESLSEEAESSSPAVFVVGSIDDREASFYLLVPPEVFERYLKMGVGQFIEGRGLLIKADPPVIKYEGG